LFLDQPVDFVETLGATHLRLQKAAVLRVVCTHHEIEANGRSGHAAIEQRLFPLGPLGARIDVDQNDCGRLLSLEAMDGLEGELPVGPLLMARGVDGPVRDCLA